MARMRGPHRPWYYLQVFGPVAFLSLFLGMVSAMSIGGVWSALRGPAKDAVLAISFAGAFAISFVVNVRRRSR